MAITNVPKEELISYLATWDKGVWVDAWCAYLKLMHKMLTRRTRTGSKASGSPIKWITID